MKAERLIVATLLVTLLTVTVVFGRPPGSAEGSAKAQEQEQENEEIPQEIKALPVVSGFSGFITQFEPGQQTLKAVVAPILLVPIGERWLVEAEFEMEGEFEREEKAWNNAFETSLEYLQLDFLANRYVTVVAGRFLTPFGIFNERLHPLWIKNLQPNPLIFPLEAGSSNGAMFRGGVRVGSGVNLTYSGYYSALSTVRRVESKQSAGGRWGVFLPGQRLEIGASFQRELEGERSNRFGVDATFQLPRTPLDFRGEYADSRDGKGYWVEGAYRLRRIRFARAFLRKSQVVVRLEQFFVPTPTAEPHEEPGHDSLRLPLSFPFNEGPGPEPNGEDGEGHGNLPEFNTTRVMLGWNYYFADGLRFAFSYGRDFAAGGDANVWSIGLTYRLGPY